jgi:hypothetical protein
LAIRRRRLIDKRFEVGRAATRWEEEAELIEMRAQMLAILERLDTLEVFQAGAALSMAIHHLEQRIGALPAEQPANDVAL